MSHETLRLLLVPSGAPLRAALESLDVSGYGICLIVDGAQRLLGILTDGDIRRAMLAGARLDAQADEVMRRDFVSLPVVTPAEAIQAALSDKIKLIPLLDADGVVVDFASAQRTHRIPLIEPSLTGNELAYVTDCIRSNWISSQGQYVRRFEQAFDTLLERDGCLAVSNGTSALHLALLALGLGPGDEVIVPDLTFAASINTVLQVGATPVLVDVDESTWTLDVTALESAIGPRTRAVMPVHLYGHPCDMDPILWLANRHGLKIVEDCAQSLGSAYKGALTGTFGDAAAFSFFGNKTITTGEGGMLVFRDRDAAARAATLRDHGMTPGRRYWHDIVGYNYRMTNLQAAIGVAQMERLDEILARKSAISARYAGGLRHLAGVALPTAEAWVRKSDWLYTIQLRSEAERTRVEHHLLHRGVESRRVFFPLHEMPLYAGFGGDRAFPAATRIAATGLSLPSAPALTDTDIDWVVQAIAEALERAEVYR